MKRNFGVPSAGKRSSFKGFRPNQKRYGTRPVITVHLCKAEEWGARSACDYGRATAIRTLPRRIRSRMSRVRLIQFCARGY